MRTLSLTALLLSAALLPAQTLPLTASITVHAGDVVSIVVTVPFDEPAELIAVGEIGGGNGFVVMPGGNSVWTGEPGNLTGSSELEVPNSAALIGITVEVGAAGVVNGSPAVAWGVTTIAAG